MFDRFSLLLLEPGEIYFQDFGVTLYALDCEEDEALKWYCESLVKMIYFIDLRICTVGFWATVYKTVHPVLLDRCCK